MTESWPKLEVARPGSWWKVEEVFVRITGGASLVYNINSVGNPADEHDRRGRIALEAFSALPMDAQLGRLQVYLDSLKGIEGSRLDQDSMRACLPELLSFVATFGPIGIGWSMELGVSNPEADRLERELEGFKHRELERQFGRPLKQVSQRGNQGWKVTFYGMAAGRWGQGTVRRLRTWPSDNLEMRIEMDQALNSDLLWSIRDEQRDLLRAVHLANAIADGKSIEIRDAARAAVGGPSQEVSLNLGIGGQTDWRRAMIGESASNEWKPFAKGSRVDWPTFGRMMLADLIGRQLNFVEPRVEVDGNGRLLMAWRARSLLEVIYLQLFEHVRARLDFGFGDCTVCGGVIVRTRRAESVKNRWHLGCAATGRQRAWRLSKGASNGSGQA